MNIDLTGKCALVTGSDRNTGRVIAEALAAAGAHLIIHSIDDRDSALETAASLHGDAVSGNIADEADCASVIEQLGALRDVDILVNNYGTASWAKWQTATTWDWLDMYQKNVLSAARLIQPLLPAMRDSGWGRIVNLGTIGSHRPAAHMPHYYSAKGALATMAVSLCQELAGTGITVNTVSPGLIHTPDLEAGYRARAKKKGWGEDWAEIETHIVAEDFPNPCMRLATRQEVADLVTFLCGPGAGFINGQNIRIDGGAVAYV